MAVKYLSEPLMVEACFYKAGEDRPSRVEKFNWNDRNKIGRFAAVADRWLRSEPGGSVQTTALRKKE